MNQPATPNLPATIVGKFNITLTNSGFQALADEEQTLVYNEDNLPAIKAFLDKTRKVEKNIENAHKEGKEDVLREGRQWDEGKRIFMGQVATIKEKPQREYEKLCREIDDRKRKEELERQRKVNIKNGIEANAVNFANMIANCKTFEQLTDVERTINLEKTRKEKYQEFLPEAVTRFTELNEFSKRQKDVIKKLVEADEQLKKAKEQEDQAAMIKAQEDKQKQEAQFEENQTRVQETAIQQAMNDEPLELAAELPDVTARRTTWEFEMFDKKEVMKKAPELLVVELDKEKVKTVLKTLKDMGAFKGKTEHIHNGIRFYEKKSY